jgi:hypothetical protein
VNNRYRKLAIESARKYLQRGWRVIRIPYRSKAPVIDGWQNLRITEAELPSYFPGRTNIGVLLGEPSGWLIDVDLDHALALELAATMLPCTGAIFGRAGKPRSHWLYYSESLVATRKWQLPDRKMVVELRSTGGQTVFPGSVHPSGEPIEWDCNGEPALADPNELQIRLERIFAEVCRRLKVPGRDAARKSVIEHNAPTSVIARARKYLAKLPPAISGQGGHAATFRAACRLVIGFGLDREQALSLLLEWNETHCQPPWSERELKHKVDDALKQPGWRSYLLSKNDRQRVAAPTSAIERANRHAIEHRRRARRRTHA